MDYRTRPLSRSQIRYIASYMRKLYKCKNKYYFDVVKALEITPILFNNVYVEIVEDDNEELGCAPATTIPDMRGNYIIKIKQSIYNDAYYKKTGGYRNHIMHEICHVFLFIIGFTPYFDRTFKNYELKLYESIEWQAKALAGEVLIPFNNTIGLNEKEIMRKCKVSFAAAHNRVKKGDK